MAARFRVGVDEVSWEMLSTITHKPLVVVRVASPKQTYTQKSIKGLT
jgi:hypothetical protein